MEQSIRIFPTSFELAETTAIEFTARVKKVLTSNPIFTVALSGGKTPMLFLSVLGDHFQGSADWDKVHFFWVDERCVPPDHGESNYGMAYNALLGKIRIPVANIHRMKGEEDPDKESIRYEKEIMDYVTERNGVPCFNMIFLGLGEDGHTASIFPGDEGLFSSVRLCSPAVHPVTKQIRITITGKVINNAEIICFLVTGSNKSAVVHDILSGSITIRQLPASYVAPPDGKVIWYLDKESGARVRNL